MTELNFQWRMGDFALEACPARLVKFYDDEPNTTIDFVKYDRHDGKEFKYSIGYFWYDDREPCWEFKFVGGRFRDISDEDVVVIFNMIKSAYNVLEAWSEGMRHE